MKLATFNINGIKARHPALCDWLDAAQPDVAVLQEIKSVDEAFPREIFEERGYNVATHGQKSFNGVAILSKLPMEDVTRGLPGDDSDEQARWIEATVTGEHTSVRICGLYLPNGNPVPGPKYDYKLAWMARLKRRAQELLDSEMPAVMAGDYNIIPQDEDAARPEAWREDALARPESRRAYREILNLGFTEAFRARRQGPGHYSFWTTKPPLTSAMTAFASITCCSRPRPRICSPIAKSIPISGAPPNPPTTFRFGSPWPRKPGSSGCNVEAAPHAAPTYCFIWLSLFVLARIPLYS